MLHVRALIKSDSVILFDPVGKSDTKLKERLLWHLQGNLKALAKRRSRDSQRRLSEWQGVKKDVEGQTIPEVHETTGDKADYKEASCDEGPGLSYEHRCVTAT
jgi:hypothetical protein